MRGPDEQPRSEVVPVGARHHRPRRQPLRHRLEVQDEGRQQDKLHAHTQPRVGGPLNSNLVFLFSF